jgi:hypothetical protein
VTKGAPKEDGVDQQEKTDQEGDQSTSRGTVHQRSSKCSRCVTESDHNARAHSTQRRWSRERDPCLSVAEDFIELHRRKLIAFMVKNETSQRKCCRIPNALHALG